MISSRQPDLVAVIVGESGALDEMLRRIPAEVRPRLRAILKLDVHGASAAPASSGLPAIESIDGSGGYGAALKRAFARALALDAAIVVTLHADGQYPPELLPQMLRPLDEQTADAVLGVRSVELLSSVDGGMPLYKFVGNRVLSTLENVVIGSDLSELHSGFRAIGAAALRSIPFELNDDNWSFDTQVLIQLHAARKRLAEVPIGTYSSPEIGFVNGLDYAVRVSRSVLGYKLHDVGLRHDPRYEVRATYEAKRSPFSSHARLLELIGAGEKTVLDVGCGSGETSRALESRGHVVTSLDIDVPTVPLHEFVSADMAQPWPLLGRRFDVIVLADVLEHVADSDALLRQALEHLSPRGCILVSLPNAVHWSVRAHVLSGRFEYMNRGILDRGHLRFFTEKTARRMFRQAGLDVVKHAVTPVPWENVVRRAARAVRALEIADLFGARIAPNLFAYQHVFRLQPFNQT